MDDGTATLDAGNREAEAKRATGAAAFGTLVEYYDFSIYGCVAATISAVFFPPGDGVASLLNTLAVFGLAFLVLRWSLFFGRLGGPVRPWANTFATRDHFGSGKAAGRPLSVGTAAFRFRPLHRLLGLRT